MRSVHRSWRVLIVWMGLALLPAAASAQSVIAGVVKDTSGAVLPGVTVEAASPALIEQVRTVSTDGEGRYSIVDLRPGVYTVTFSLAGFSTVKRPDLQLQSNISLPINAEMKVGAVEETLTVTGAAPVVDVQSTTRTAVMTRDMLDSIPNARNLQSIGAMVPGIKLSLPDVGGSQQMEQTYITTHGNGARDTTVQVDGMMINGIQSDGQIQAYTDNALVEEATYQTSGVTAEVSAGGVRLNMIPREGGNTISGAGFLGMSSGDWQGNNVSPELIARGFAGNTRIEHIKDYNASMGGPIKKDKLWFFTSGRYQSTNDQIANAFYSDGSPGIQDQFIKSMSLRLTYQASPRNKFSAYAQRIYKLKGHEIQALQDVGTASLRRDPARPAFYLISQAKWTSTVSSKFLLEAGFSTNIERYTAYYQPGIMKERWTPEWYANASRFDRTLGTRKTAGSVAQGQFPDRYVAAGSASYVTGSHSFKTGVQWTYGPFVQTRDSNADLVQEYLNGVPASVTVNNTPTRSIPRLDMDLGIFAQDTWSVKRFTINAGLRFDYLRGSLKTQDAPAGRFAPARHYDPVDCNTLPGMTCWSSLSPRLGFTYDVFGTGKTAVKASFGRYEQSETTGFISVYNPMFYTSERRTWKDTNGDDIAQDSEIGPSPNAAFGTFAGRRPDPSYQREYNLQYSAGVQHELVNNVSLTVNTYRRHGRNLPIADNLNYSRDDWAQSTTISPLSGEQITVYNLNKAKYGLPQDIVDMNSDQRRITYTGVEASVMMRLPRRSNVSISWGTERTVEVSCDNPDDPNTLRFCDQSQLAIPFRHEWKFSGNIPLWYGFQASASFVSNPGAQLAVTWNVTASTRAPDGSLVIPNMTQPAQAIALVAPGTKYLDRWNQLDLGFKRVFRFGGKKEIHGQVDLFNFLNSNVAITQNQTWGSSLDRPLSILQPRTLRLAAQFRF